MAQDLKKCLELLIEKAVKELAGAPSKVIPSVQLEIPKDKTNGDFASNLALKIAADFKESPLHVANKIKEVILRDIGKGPLSGQISNIEVKPPGFVNFFLTNQPLYELLKEILEQKNNFGKNKITDKQKVLLEFVSANPTGPLSVAHARQAAVGDALSNIFRFLGIKLQKEYYINDEGTQIDILGKSIFSRYQELLGEATQFPENGYQGEYIYDIAKEFIEKSQAKKSGAKKLDAEFFSKYGLDYILKINQDELDAFRVKFDNFIRQSAVSKPQNIRKALALLKKKGFIYEKDGATWFKSTAFGDDKDRVVIKSEGSFTYLAPDIAYHQDKFKRGFDWVINIWGPDHHGYIPRLKAAVAALGYKHKKISIIIVQLATLFKQGKPVSMSTRRGQYISLREVIDEVGVDAARFFFLMRRTDSHLDFDLELAKKQSAQNPLFYIQYAHARIASILSSAKTNASLKDIDFEFIRQPQELELIKKISQFPDTVLACQKILDPFPLVGYLQELATDFHKFYDTCRVINADNDMLTQARLALIEAVKIILESGLNLLGVSAPDKM